MSCDKHMHITYLISDSSPLCPFVVPCSRKECMNVIKYFEIYVSGSPHRVSVDRLKPAFVNNDSSSCVGTCSGCVSCAPLFFQGGMVAVVPFSFYKSIHAIKSLYALVHVKPCPAWLLISWIANIYDLWADSHLSRPEIAHNCHTYWHDGCIKYIGWSFELDRHIWA